MSLVSVLQPLTLWGRSMIKGWWASRRRVTIESEDLEDEVGLSWEVLEASLVIVWYGAGQPELSRLPPECL